MRTGRGRRVPRASLQGHEGLGFRQRGRQGGGRKPHNGAGRCIRPLSGVTKCAILDVCAYITAPTLRAVHHPHFVTLLKLHMAHMLHFHTPHVVLHSPRLHTLHTCREAGARLPRGDQRWPRGLPERVPPAPPHHGRPPAQLVSQWWWCVLQLFGGKGLGFTRTRRAASACTTCTSTSWGFQLTW